MRRATGLQTHGRGVAGARQSDTKRLAGAIAKASSPGSEGLALWLERPSGRRLLVVLVAAFRLDTGWLDATRPCTIMTVTDPERTPVPSEARLMQLYGLTRAEAAIGVRLLGGRDLA